MATSFYPTQELSRGDLDIYLVDGQDAPLNAFEIFFALYFVDPATQQEVLIGGAQRVPANPSIGEYYAPLLIPPSAQSGTYRIRWRFKQLANTPEQMVVQEFSVVDKGIATASTLSANQLEMVNKLRVLIRDQNPDKYYHFRPPTSEENISQFNRVFGQIWEDAELLEYLERALDWFNMFPPETETLNTIDKLVQNKPAWRTAILWGAISHAMYALSANWTADEFDYSIGGISLNLEKSSKYESLKQGAETYFDKATEAKARTTKFVRGLQQPKYGIGVRSAFGPNVGRGVLSPRNFI